MYKATVNVSVTCKSMAPKFYLIKPNSTQPSLKKGNPIVNSCEINVRTNKKECYQSETLDLEVRYVLSSTGLV